MWSSGSSYSSRDLQEYRAGYPTKVDRPDLKKNVQFYRNEIVCDPDNAFIDDIHDEWKGDYSWLESGHSYVQWLFPIQEPGLNPRAQVLQKHEAATMRADPTIIRRVIKSYALMLDFYGFDLVDEATGVVRRQAAGKFESRFENLNYSSHNYLRITRILKFLGEMGLEHMKLPWLKAFSVEIYDTKLLENCRESYEDYWCHALCDDRQREGIIVENTARPPRARKSWGWGGGMSAMFDDDSDRKKANQQKDSSRVEEVADAGSVASAAGGSNANKSAASAAAAVGASSVVAPPSPSDAALPVPAPPRGDDEAQ